MIPQEIIDQVLDRTDIVEVISGAITLKKAGRSFKANCPFHNEKTPSFIVSPDKQIFHCFGCGAGGNVIGFVMKYDNMTFPEAVEMLAQKAGVEVPRYGRENTGSISHSARIQELNSIAASFYQSYLRSEKGKQAYAYLMARKLDPKTITEFRIGYAPDGWENLKKYCENRNIPLSLAKHAGLLSRSEKTGNDYDRFRNRIIFPIFSDRGKIVAFGARVLDNSLPKYINSPEGPVYNKSNILYGLNFARKGIRKKGYAVIVEGYMDVILPYQHGINNVIATSGTALTDRQVTLLKRQTDTAVILFDSDQAGITASLRGLDILIQKGMKVRISTLPRGEDPASFVVKHGKEAFLAIIEKAKDLFDYKLDILTDKFGNKDIAAITEEMLPTLAKVDNIVLRSHYLKRLADCLDVDEASIRQELGKIKPDKAYRYEGERHPETVGVGACSNSEIYLLGMALTHKDKYERIMEEIGIENFHNASVKKALKLIEDAYTGGDKKINAGKLLSRTAGDNGVENIIMQAMTKAEITEDGDKVIDDCIVSIKKHNKKERLKELNAQLKDAENAHNEEKIMEIVKKINNIHKQKVA